ncbi:terpenoid cyclases/protein prenyltransferase alpha-alpha toroid [Aspergillus ambiguus]|uniref:CAAX farnesyltransferase subunit beta RAM1 n=1 Tax=Aspergillus ambiguus TaxID=176160 RepID=UPI003CCE24D1
MPLIAATGKNRHQVRFSSGRTSNSTLRPAAKSRDLQSRRESVAMEESSSPGPVPALFTESPLLQDSLPTETTDLQNETINKCLPFLKGLHKTQKGPFNSHGVPALKRDEHIGYLYDSLEDYPAGFVAMDSSRPWMAYWALAGLSLLGEDVTKFRQRIISTFGPMQNPTGGFGGGHGQMSHCASSYAAVLSLAMVGGGEVFQLIDRRAMWEWLGRLKQPDGGFRVCEGAEEDVRGAYCAMVIISLLDLPLTLPAECEARKAGLETFTSGLSDYLARCQTFEGGISGSPGSEAHGAYAFCALACLSILDKPEISITRCMDIPLLLSWLSSRQYAPEGGFSGRTNKLVDGCYSHWVGSCWPLLQSALDGTQSETGPASTAVGDLYSREGLTRYILGCCQGKDGGLRDKPGKHVDSYHSCYTLTGLSMVQYRHYYTDVSASAQADCPSAFSWKSLPIKTAPVENPADVNVFDESDRLTAFHPIYVIPHRAAEEMRLWFENDPLEV